MPDDRLISKPLPQRPPWLPPIVESATWVVDACAGETVPDVRRCLNAALVLAASQIVQKLSAAQLPPDVLLKLVESLRDLYALADPSTAGGSVVNDRLPPDYLGEVVRNLYGIHEVCEHFHPRVDSD